MKGCQNTLKARSGVCFSREGLWVVYNVSIWFYNAQYNFDEFNIPHNLKVRSLYGSFRKNKAS